MDEDICIIISDDENEADTSQADVSVQVIGEINNKQNQDSVKLEGGLDSSVIDLTGGNDFSFLSSSQPCPQTPSKPFSSSQPLTEQSYSPPLFDDSPSSTPKASPSPDFFKESSLSSSSSARRTASSCSSKSVRELTSPGTTPKKLTSKQLQRQQDKAKRDELRQQRLKEKEIERVHKEANRANTASKATQNCFAIIDRSILKLINDPEEANFKTLFEESALLYKMTDYPKYDSCVTWDFKRTEVQNNSCVTTTKETDLILNVMDGGDYVRKIFLYREDPKNPESLYNFITQLRLKSQAMIVILVYNLNAYLKAERAKEAKEYQKKFKQRFESGEVSAETTSGNKVSASNIDLEEIRLTLLVDLEYNNPDWKLHIEFYEKTKDVVDSIVRCTKSTASREIAKKEQATTMLDWAINMDKDKAIDPTKSQGDLTRLWIAQLQQFSQITLPIAKTIAAEYPSPSALLDQYQSLTDEEAQDLLAELHVQRNLKRQVGPNISRRIYRFLTSTDPNLHIGFD